jgi:hypothetical protein
MAEDDEHKKKDTDLSDILQELRILLPGAQVMTAFLTILPFNSGFPRMLQPEKYVFIATYLCSLTSLVLLSTPAAAHRLERPLTNREQFKTHATRLMIVALVFLSITLVLATQVVVSQVLSEKAGIVAAVPVLVLVLIVWWIVPLSRRHRE